MTLPFFITSSPLSDTAPFFTTGSPLSDTGPFFTTGSPLSDTGSFLTMGSPLSDTGSFFTTGSPLSDTGPFFTTGSPLSDTAPTCENCSTDRGPMFDPSILAQVNYLTDLALSITLICYIPIIIFGLFGNTVAFMLLIKSAKTSSTYIYLCSMAVFDNIFLTATIGNWILFSTTGTDLRRILDCNFMYILYYISKETSTWLVVAVSVERVLVIYRPTKAKSITSVKRARALVGFIILMTAILNWHAFGAYKTVRSGSDARSPVCPGRTPWLHYYTNVILGWVDGTVYVYIPIICLIVLNGAIVAKFTAAARINKVNPNISQAMAKNSRKMTVMGLTLSGTFIVLSLPHCIHKLVFRTGFDMAGVDPVGFFTHFLISQILSTLYRTNHSINLALYCMTNSSFRKELWRLLTCKRWRKVGNSSDVGTTRTTSRKKKTGHTKTTTANPR